METQQEMLERIESEDFFIGLDRFIQDNGWNVFEDIFKQLKTRYNPRVKKNRGEYSICPCVISLGTKTHLTHNERLALMMTLLPLGKDSELIEIMKKQDNYKESVTFYQISNYKAKGRMKGITKAKLKEWGICKC